jgi:hypothetical protein
MNYINLPVSHILVCLISYPAIDILNLYPLVAKKGIRSHYLNDYFRFESSLISRYKFMIMLSITLTGAP